MSTRRATLAVLVVLLVTLPACGLPEDAEPRAIAPDQLPEPLRGIDTASPNTGQETGVTLPIYLVARRESDDEDPRLEAVPVIFDGRPTPDVMVDRLLEERPGEEDAVSTAIPFEVELLSHEFEGDTATLTLNEAFGDAEGGTQRLAVAQIVWTVTETAEISNVRFRVDRDGDGVDGDPIEVNAGDAGQQPVVTRDHYLDLRPELIE
jgi:spore germination protein GerM